MLFVGHRSDLCILCSVMMLFLISWIFYLIDSWKGSGLGVYLKWNVHPIAWSNLLVHEKEKSSAFVFYQTVARFYDI